MSPDLHTTAAALLALVGALLLVTPASAQPGERSYAVIVAHNQSLDPSVRPLRYADDDGARYWEIFSALTDEVQLLTTLDDESQAIFGQVAPHTRPPTRAAVLDALRQAQARIREDRAQGVRTTLYVVFAGHGAVEPGGMGSMSLLDAPFTRDDLLREVVEPDVADRTHIIIDACNAYFMVHARGDGQAWRDDRSGESLDAEFEAFLRTRRTLTRYPRVGALLSTAGAAEVHEWSEYRGGVFSHEVRSGLLGAADVNGDRAVTYPELEAYLEAANALVRDPRARIHVHAEAPRQNRDEVVLRLSGLRQATMLEVAPGAAGRYHVADSRGVRYADFHAAGDGPFHLALLGRAPLYFVRTEATEARLEPSGQLVRLAELDFVQRDARRGPVEESYRANLFGVPFGQGFYAGYHAARARASSAAPRVEAAAPALDGWGLQLGYVASGAQMTQLEGAELDTQHSLELGADLWLTPWLAAQVFGQYGASQGREALPGGLQGDPFRLDRFAGGVGLKLSLPSLPLGLGLDLDLRTAHQWLVADGSFTRCAPGDEACVEADRVGDAFSWRGEAGLTLRRAVVGPWEVGVRGGISASLVTLQRQDGDTRETVDLLPFVGVTTGLRF